MPLSSDTIRHGPDPVYFWKICLSARSFAVAGSERRYLLQSHASPSTNNVTESIGKCWTGMSGQFSSTRHWEHSFAINGARSFSPINHCSNWQRRRGEEERQQDRPDPSVCNCLGLGVVASEKSSHLCRYVVAVGKEGIGSAIGDLCRGARDCS